MPRWLLAVLLLLVVGTLVPRAHALPPPPPADRSEWQWEPVPVHHDLDPAQASAHAPYVPAGTPSGAGPLLVEPGHAVLVWVEAFDTVRVRSLAPAGRGRLTFTRLQPGVERAFARIEEPGVPKGAGIWWLRSIVGRGEPWLVESDRRLSIVVERPVPRLGGLIWEHVHEAAMSWVDGEGSLPRLPAVPGGERWATRRLADRELAEVVRRLPGFDEDVDAALSAWRRYRASIELDGLRSLSDRRAVGPEGAAVIEVPQLVDPLVPEDPTLDDDRVRLTSPWSFRVRGPSVLRLRVRALLPGEGPPPPPLDVVVTTPGDDGNDVVLARLVTTAAPLRVRDPSRPGDPIPTWVDAVATTGEHVSKEHVLTVPLRPGRHAYRVESRGGPIAMTGELGRVLGRAHGRQASQWRERERARVLARIEGLATPAASVVRALYANPWQARATAEARPEDPRVRAWLELEALEHADASAAERATSAARIARALPRRPRPDALDVELRVRAFELQRAAERSDAAVETLRGVARLLDGDELPALVAAVEDPGTLWPLEGALDVVARRAPLTTRLRSAYVKLWTWTRWSRLHPSVDAPSWEWIEPARPDDPPALPRALGRVSSLPLGRVVELVAPAHAYEADRTPLLRVLVRAPAAVDGVLALEVDGQRWSAPMQGSSEVIEVAVPVGTHRVRLDAPAGAEAFSSLHPAAAPEALAGPAPVLTTMWPAQWEDRPVRFELGALPRDTLAEVDVRVVGVPAHGEPAPVELWICFDDGSRRRVRIVPGPAARELLAITAPAAGSQRARVVVPVPARATELWVEPVGGATLAVAAKLRQWEPPATATAPRIAARGAPSPSVGSPARTDDATAASTSAEPAADRYDRLAASTRRIAAEPESASLLLAHAHRLLDVGDVRRARLALARVIEREPLEPEHPLLPAVRTLAARIDAFIDDAFVELQPAAGPGPLLLQPAAAALAPADPTRAEVLVAAAAAHEGRLREAFERHARVYVDTGALGPGYAAAQAYARALAAAAPGAVDPELASLRPLAYGLVERLRRTVDTPKLRRLHNYVVEATRWEPLSLVERSAGTHDQGTDIAPLELTDAMRLQWALLAPPLGPTEAQLLRPGSLAVMVVELPEPREIDVEAFCDDLEPSRPGQPSAALEIHMGDPVGATTHRSLATPARTIVHERLALLPGATRLELELPGGSEERRCAVRWVAADPAAPVPTAEHPKRWLLARPGSPVEAIVLGPTTLQLEVAPGRDAEAVTATVELASLTGEDARTLTVTPGEPSTLLVARPGPLRVAVTTAGDELLVRLALRRDTGVEPLATPIDADDDERPPSRPLSTRSLGPAFERARILWPAGANARLHERIGEPTVDRTSRIGSFEAALGYSRTDISETDAPRPRDQLRGSLLWRRELVPERVWIKLASHTQGRSGAGAAAGAEATVYAQRGPRRLRGSGSVAAWSERYAGAPAWSLRVSAVVDRPTNITPTLVLVPFVRGLLVFQSLDEPGFAPATEASNPAVYSPYLEDHPLAITPGARLRWFPFQDLQLVGEVSTTPNSDFASIDHVDAELGLHGIVLTRIPLLVRYGGSYGSSLRLADADRSRTFVLHGPRLAVGLTYMLGRGQRAGQQAGWLGRLNLDVYDTVTLSELLPARNGVDVILSLDLVLGRGIRDSSPMEMLFRPQYRNQWWQPAPAARAP